MRDANQVVLCGNVAADAGSTTTRSGKEVVNFTMATNRSYKVGEEWKTEVSWHRVTHWPRQGEGVSLRKGERVVVLGRIQSRTYEKDGEKRTAVDIVAESVIQCLGKARETRNDDTGEVPFSEDMF